MLGFKGKLLDWRADDMDVQTLISIDFMYCICMLSSFAESIVSRSWHPLASVHVSTIFTLRIGFFHLHQYPSWKCNVLWAWHPMPTTPWVGSW